VDQFHTRYESCQVQLTLDRGKTKLLCDLGVLDLTSLLQSHSLDPLCHITARGDSGSTSECLEFDIGNDSIVIDSDL